MVIGLQVSAFDEAERGIPQSWHVFRAAGDSPGGLRKSQISQSQASNGSSADDKGARTTPGAGLGEDVETADADTASSTA